MVKKNPSDLKKNDDKCFQYAKKIALNHERIKVHPERITKIKHFINQYKWEKISIPSHKKRLEKV